MLTISGHQENKTPDTGIETMELRPYYDRFFERSILFLGKSTFPTLRLAIAGLILFRIHVHVPDEWFLKNLKDLLVHLTKCKNRFMHWKRMCSCG